MSTPSCIFQIRLNLMAAQGQCVNNNQDSNISGAIAHNVKLDAEARFKGMVPS